MSSAPTSCAIACANSSRRVSTAPSPIFELSAAAAPLSELSGLEAASAPARLQASLSVIDRLKERKPDGRLVLNLPYSATALPGGLGLEDNDQIFIPPRPKTVGVFGAVYRAGILPVHGIDPDRRLPPGGRRPAEDRRPPPGVRRPRERLRRLRTAGAQSGRSAGAARRCDFRSGEDRPQLLGQAAGDIDRAVPVRRQRRDPGDPGGTMTRPPSIMEFIFGSPWARDPWKRRGALTMAIIVLAVLCVWPRHYVGPYGDVAERCRQHALVRARLGLRHSGWSAVVRQPDRQPRLSDRVGLDHRAKPGRARRCRATSPPARPHFRRPRAGGGQASP